MFIEGEKELFATIANSIVLSEQNKDWKYAVLEIKLLESSVRSQLNFYSQNDERKSVGLENSFECAVELLKLRKLTRENPNYAAWNKAFITLQSDYKIKIEYSWDQKWQDKLDIAKKTSSRCPIAPARPGDPGTIIYAQAGDHNSIFK